MKELLNQTLKNPEISVLAVMEVCFMLRLYIILTSILPFPSFVPSRCIGVGFLTTKWTGK